MNRGSGIAAMADGFPTPAARTPADLLRGWQMVRRIWEEPKLERERGFPNCTRITQPSWWTLQNHKEFRSNLGPKLYRNIATK